MKKLPVMSLLLCAGLTACSPVNSEFSCNKTAGDSCLTIEQVDAMTHYADDPILTKKTHKTKTRHHVRENGVWLSTQRQQG